VAEPPAAVTQGAGTQGAGPPPLTAVLVGFCAELRRAGLPAGTGDVLAYVTAAAALDPSDLVDLYWAGRVTLVTRLVEEFRDRAPRRRALMPSREGEPRLTSREWEVLELMRRRMTTAQIARTLVVSPATVRSHVAAILRKLRVPDRDAAVRLLDPAEHE